MNGVIAIAEDRNTISRLKSFKEKAKGITEEEFDDKINIIKNTVEVAGVAATVTLAVCPLDGPFGELAALLATPVFVKAIEALREPLKALLVKKENRINASLINNSGDTKDISLSDDDLVQNVDSRKASFVDSMTL